MKTSSSKLNYKSKIFSEAATGETRERDVKRWDCRGDRLRPREDVHFYLEKQANGGGVAK
jgi:hypothetical protein